jgi:lysylphosphatidylglycerol synthetase-like protein (DUF2156 family)
MSGSKRFSPQAKPTTLRLAKHQKLRRLVSIFIFLDGLLNVVVSTLRPLRYPLHEVLTLVPLGLVQSAAAITAVAGIGLIMLARGLSRGQHRAWALTTAILGLTVITHFARGGTFVSLGLALILLAVLLTTRSAFRVQSDRISARAGLSLLALVAVVVPLSTTLVFELRDRHGGLPNFSLMLLACLERLVGQTSIMLPTRVSDFTNPTLLTIGITLVVFTMFLLLRPIVDRRLSTPALLLERRIAELRARDIVRRYGTGSLDYFSLRNDKRFFFYHNSLVAYAIYNGVALVSPDPIGPDSQRLSAWTAFRSHADLHGWTIGVMAASEEWSAIYKENNMHELYIGDEAIVDCAAFTLSGRKMKGLRQACTRVSRYGYTVEFLDPSKLSSVRAGELRDLLVKERRGEEERGFSMVLGRFFDPKDKGLLLAIVLDSLGHPAAFCQFVPSHAGQGYSLDVMRRDPTGHPNGLIDYALCETIFHIKQLGATELSLNFAAFRSILDGEKEGFSTGLQRLALSRLSGGLQIESLWKFNAKYLPTWQPRFLVYPAPEKFVPVVTAILRSENLTEIPLFGKLLTYKVPEPTNV